RRQSVLHRDAQAHRRHRRGPRGCPRRSKQVQVDATYKVNPFMENFWANHLGEKRKRQKERVYSARTKSCHTDLVTQILPLWILHGWLQLHQPDAPRSYTTL